MTLRLVIIVVNIYPNTCRPTVAAAATTTTAGRGIYSFLFGIDRLSAHGNFMGFNCGNR